MNKNKTIILRGTTVVLIESLKFATGASADIITRRIKERVWKEVLQQIESGVIYTRQMDLFDNK